MISSRDKVCMKYSVLVILKLLLAFVGAILSLVAAILFATQTDDPRTGVYITRGLAFYLQILTIALSLGLLIMSIYDRILSRKPGGDPTITPDITGVQSTTYNNPGFRETNRNNLGEYRCGVFQWLQMELNRYSRYRSKNLEGMRQLKKGHMDNKLSCKGHKRSFNGVTIFKMKIGLVEWVWFTFQVNLCSH